MAEIQDKVDVCPACGKQTGDAQPCCEARGKAALEAAIPIMAEVRGNDGSVRSISSRWFRIGRDNDNDIVLDDDTYVSRYHAWITFERDHFWVEDLGSTNGTLLNGAPLQRRELLASGDKIKIGESEMTFVLLEKTGSGS
jgi:pSer/pThr/pTyr-binding forkhead associated (FHA) protein